MSVSSVGKSLQSVFDKLELSPTSGTAGEGLAGAEAVRGGGVDAPGHFTEFREEFPSLPARLLGHVVRPGASWLVGRRRPPGAAPHREGRRCGATAVGGSPSGRVRCSVMSRARGGGGTPPRSVYGSRQSTGAAPCCARKSLVRLKGREPKKPRSAERGDGWTDSMTG